MAYSAEWLDSNIWRVDLRGTGQKPLSPTRFIYSTRKEWEPAYSRDGQRIAFVSDRSGNFEIWVCDSDGSNAIPLTSMKAKIVFGPKWSPDGKTIAFYAVVKGNSDVYVMSANGGVPRRLTNDPAQDRWPGWSRDGQFLYFVSNRGGTHEIWKMLSTGAEPVQINRNEHGGDLPHESPDGKFLYYSKGYPNPQSVWRVPADGGGESIKILDAVSPDGLWTVGNQGIYFFSVPDKQGSSGICLYDFATGKTRRILNIQRPAGYFIEVSPDGKTILFPQVDDSGSDLMLVENFR